MKALPREPRSPLTITIRDDGTRKAVALWRAALFAALGLVLLSTALRGEGDDSTYIAEAVAGIAFLGPIAAGLVGLAWLRSRVRRHRMVRAHDGQTVFPVESALERSQAAQRQDEAAASVPLGEE